MERLKQLSEMDMVNWDNVNTKAINSRVFDCSYVKKFRM